MRMQRDMGCSASWNGCRNRNKRTTSFVSRGNARKWLLCSLVGLERESNVMIYSRSPARVRRKFCDRSRSKFVESFLAQLAGVAFRATETPFVLDVSLSSVASMRVPYDEIHEVGRPILEPSSKRQLYSNSSRG